MHEILSYPLFVFEAIKNMRGKTQYNVFYEIIKAGVITEIDLQKKVMLDRKTLNKIIEQLYIFGLIERYRDKQSFLIIYLLGREILSNSIRVCGECKYHKSLRKLLADKKVKTVECNAKWNNFCAFNQLRLQWNAAKVVRINCEMMPFETYVRMKQEDNVDPETKDVEIWNRKDFVTYMLKLQREYTPDFVYDRSYISNLRNSFKLLVERIKKTNSDAWKKLAKCYMYMYYQKHKKKGTALRWKFMVDEHTYRQFMDKLGEEINEIELCKAKKINCKYMVDGVCEIKSGGLDCNQDIVDTMRRRYN